eukprot:scaffold68964_cov30-Phaeocystis_antarctica.AAC.1
MVLSTASSTTWPPWPTGSTTQPWVCRVSSLPRITADARLAERGLVLTPVLRPRLTKRRCEGASPASPAASPSAAAAGAAAGLTR